MTLKIYNVMTRQKQEFVPLTPGAVKMYACGITVSADAHIGHAYQSVVFDVITRYFAYLGYNVKYVRNYTDVDDKIIANAMQPNTLLTRGVTLMDSPSGTTWDIAL